MTKDEIADIIRDWVEELSDIPVYDQPSERLIQEMLSTADRISSDCETRQGQPRNP